MKGSVRSWWINALVITTVVFMWLSLAGSVAIGIALANASADTSGNEIESNCNYDSDLQGFYDELFNPCTP